MSMWRINKDGKFKRMLAAWIGISMVMQILVGSLAPLGTYADDTIYQVITVRESEILAGAKSVADGNQEHVPKIKKSVLPYSNDELKEDAVDKITPFLMGTAIVKQESLKNKCSYIVAVNGEELPASGSEVRYAAEDIVFIGLNGNQDKDCVFTLQIVNADDIVIRSMTIITYQQDSSAATMPKASRSEATPSEEGVKPGTPSMATPPTASGSDLTGYEFVEVGSREELGEEEVTDLVQKGEIATPGELAMLEGPVNPEYAVGPKMTAPARGFAIAYAESGANARGKVAQIRAFVEDGEDTVQSGATGTFHIAADYSVVDDKLPEFACFTVQFEVKDHEGNAYEHVKGPETEPTAKPVSALESDKQQEWKKLQEMLAGTDDYVEAAGCDDWQLISVETNQYFYSASAKLAVFGVKNGETAIMDLPMFFSFDNYITPVGSKITAKLDILNKEELKEAYESNAGPAHSGDMALIIGDDVTITSTAEFRWQGVTQSSQSNLGNMASGEGTEPEIIFRASAEKDYRNDVGRLYTTDYTVTDTLYFEGFTLDVNGYQFTQDTNNKKGELYLTKEGRSTKLIGLKLPGGYDAGEVEVTPLYRYGEEASRIVTGVEVRYSRKNTALDGQSPADMADIADDQMNVYLGIGNIRSDDRNMIKYDSEAAGKVPSVRSEVDLIVHSIMYDGAERGSLKENDGITNHHSSASVTLTAETGYPLTKMAYTDSDCTIEASGVNKIFEPGATVYYKISVKNNGYTYEKFDIVDSLPDGVELDEVEVKTVSVTVGRKTLTEAQYTDAPPVADSTKGSAVKTWGQIPIPSGQEAIVVFSAKLKGKEAFSDQNINTTQTNAARWYRSTDASRQMVLGNDDATIYVNLNTLRKEDVTFTKSIETNPGSEGTQAKTVPAIGSMVTYHLKAELNDGVQYSHWITLKDNWPDGVTLNEISNIPSQAVVRVTDDNGKTLQYENTDSEKASWKISGLDSKSVKVEARVSLSPPAQSSVDLKLDGTVNREGTITNSASAGGGEDEDWEISGSASFYAIGAAIEKKAYYISKAQSGAITDEVSKLHPVDQSVTFRTGDVVCYEITLSNKGKDTFIATVKDDIKELFGEGIAPEFAEADLGAGVKGSVFMTDPVFMTDSVSDKWKKLNPPTDGVILQETGALGEGKKAVFRIYLKIPDGDPEQVTKLKLQPNNKASATLNYEGENRYTIEASASITINQDVQEASIEKTVYAVARELEEANGRVYLKGARWNNKELGTDGKGYVPNEETLKVGKGDYVFYRITITNESDAEDLQIHEIEDWLPDGMEFVRFYEFNGKGNNSQERIPGKTGSGGDTLDLGIAQWAEKLDVLDRTGENWLYYEDALEGDPENAAAAVSHYKTHTSINGTAYRARLYRIKDGKIDTGSKEAAVIPLGRSVVYGIIARVTGDFKSGTELTNTTGVIVDQSAKTDEKYDKMVSELAQGPVGERSYSNELYKITTAQASVKTTGIYTPGIEKALAQYRTGLGWENYNPNGDNERFLPNYPMRWKLELNNGTNTYMTRGPIENYTIVDTFPAGLTYNEADPEGNSILIPGGKSVLLPKPLMGRGEDGNVTASWTIEKQPDGYKITGESGEVTETEENLSIPAKGKLTVQVGSRADGDGTAKYGTYVNQADLIPAEEYEFSEACVGTLVRDEEGRPAAVHAGASVDIFYGEGRTEAWKEISGSFNGEQYQGDGREKDRNSIIADAGSEVVYTLNIRNQVKKGIENLVIVDRLPAVKDNSLVNNMQRNSDFKVCFAANPEITVNVKKADGRTVTLSQEDDYDVVYTDWNSKFGKGSVLPAREWEPDGGKDWETTSAGNDTFRIAVHNEALELATNDMVIVTYHAQLPEAKDLVLSRELIAWNTFGYAYRAVDSSNTATITVEPAKVGVQIPTASLSVTKKVESRFEDDKNSRFTFSLEIEDGKDSRKWKSAGNMPYQLTSGASGQTGSGKTDENGEFTLSHGETAAFTVLAGSGYRVKEKQADGYYVAITDFNGVTWGGQDGGNSKLFTPKNLPAVTLDSASSGNNYSCIFINTRSSFFLPETGGSGSGMFKRSGMGVFLLSLLMLAGCLTGNRIQRKKEELSSIK